MTSLKPLHTFHLAHVALNISVLKTLDDFRLLANKKVHKDFLILGEGSNSVFLSDVDIPIYKNEYLGKFIKEDDKNFYLEVCSGENWHKFVEWCLEKGIYGFENLALIPGTVGAAPIQNIGAYGVEIQSLIDSVECFNIENGRFDTLYNHECKFGYRDSVFKNEFKEKLIVTSVRFRVTKNWQPVLKYGELKEMQNPTPHQIFQRVCKIRNSKLPDPAVIGNAGSFFKNPIISKSALIELQKSFPDMPCYEINKYESKVAAGWLIDQAGLKGSIFGEVQVNPKQALVLTNYLGNAKGSDVVKAATAVIDKVMQKFGISLEPEVRFFGLAGEIIYSRESFGSLIDEKETV